MPKIFRLDRKHLVLGYLVLLGLSGAIILWINTSVWGIGVGYDSYFYLTAADNFTIGNGLGRIDGNGNLIPLVHFPPVYPLILAGTSILAAGDTIVAARILAAFFLGVNIVLIGWLAYANTSSILASFIASGFALVSPLLLDVHLMAMSEPVFLTIVLLTLYALGQYVQNGKRRTLAISAGLAGLTFLIRYAGTSTIALGVIVILIFGRFNLSKRIKHAMYFGFVSMLFMAPWLIRNWVVTGSLTNRTPIFHLPDSDKLLKGVFEVATWISPTLLPNVLKTSLLAQAKLLLVVAVIILGVGLWVMRMRRKLNKTESELNSSRFAIILFIYIVVYLFFLLISLTYFDASTRLNGRILSPVYTVVLILGIVIVWNGYSFMLSQKLSTAVIIIAVLFLSIDILDSYGTLVGEMRENGRGFTGREWRNSETIKVANDLPSDLTIFTNEPFAVHVLTGRLTSSLPENFNPVKQEANSTFDAQMEIMMEVFRLGNGALVLFDSYYKHDVYASEVQLTQSLVLWRDTADGSVYVPEGFVP